MTDASDIITYIGVPLAVLGVLPILYTFIFSILTQRRIRKLLLSHGHRPHGARKSQQQEGFVLRASPMTSLIEVEMPRYTIAPVERDEELYWEVSGEMCGRDVGERVGLLAGHGHGHGHGNTHGRAHGEGPSVERVESSLSMIEEGRVRGFLRGGSWRTFHWRRLVVGRKLYRIQYEDELREPPAEIEFAELVNFLMDWGAELDGMGWEKLRSGGLWTPAGTVLLKVCDEYDSDVESKNGSVRGTNGDWVLRTSMPDDSDGILTLCVRWPPGRAFGSARNATSLPPGLGRLYMPATMDEDQNQDARKRTLTSTITTLTSTTKHLPKKTTSFRFKLDSTGLITEVHPETNSKETGHVLSTANMAAYTLGAEWFTSGISALLTLTQTSNPNTPTNTSTGTGTLWGHNPPADLLTFLRKDTIPCGILVLLNILPEDSAPHWDSNPQSEAENRILGSQHHARFMARQQAERLEATMPPEQARVHRMNREAEERRSQLDETRRLLEGRRAAEVRRMQDALGSSRLGCTRVAEVCLAWLVEMGFVDWDCTAEDGLLGVVRRELTLMLLQSQTIVDEVENSNENKNENGENSRKSRDTEGTIPILKILQEWIAWSDAGGMKREQFELLEQYKVEFCYAACLVEVIHREMVISTGKGKASVDMLGCLKMWRKVRLG